MQAIIDSYAAKCLLDGEVSFSFTSSDSLGFCYMKLDEFKDIRVVSDEEFLEILNKGNSFVGKCVVSRLGLVEMICFRGSRGKFMYQCSIGRLFVSSDITRIIFTENDWTYDMVQFNEQGDGKDMNLVTHLDNEAIRGCYQIFPKSTTPEHQGKVKRYDAKENVFVKLAEDYSSDETVSIDVLSEGIGKTFERCINKFKAIDGKFHDLLFARFGGLLI